MQFKNLLNQLNMEKRETLATAGGIAAFLAAVLLALYTAALQPAQDSPAAEAEAATPSIMTEAFTAAATPSDMTDPDAAVDYSSFRYHKPSSLLKDINLSPEDQKEELFVPGPEKLNLAWFYPDDAETNDSIHSYAGRIYQDLHVENAGYYASFYDLMDKTPLQMAQELGLDKSRVMGKYNPQDSAHDPGNPDTWTVNSFKNVNVQFYSGDGERINGYYLVKEIMSLANVYAFYHKDYSYEHMKQYCEALFDSAVTYSVSLGTVYYDNGCLNKTKSQESAEALAEEANRIARENKLSVSTAKSSGERINGMEVFTDLTDITTEEGGSPDGTESIEEIIDASQTAAETTEVHYYEETTTAAPTEASQISETPAETAATTAAATEQQTVEEIEEIIDDSSNTKVLGESWYAPDYYLTEETSSSASAKEASSSAASNIIIAPTTTEAETASEAEESGSYAVVNSGGSVSASGKTIANAVSDAISETISETLSEAEKQAQDEAAKRYIELLRQANIQSSADNYCPGHIDITVKVTLRGIDDKNSLFKADKIGNDEKNFTASWKGWTDEMMAHARALNEQDWLELYGLSISSINLMNPLSAAEIDQYLDQLPEDISEERKEIIRFALNSVGNVPYYWGGKPAGAGYEVNHFYTLIEPDYTGRILKGLDCSGWINWVYWSVTGHSLAGQSTGTLIGCGKRISRSGLQPGDIIIRTGDDAHVVMFLSWAEDGDFYAIHETGNITNNVTVSKVTANWPYYRSLIN